MPLATVAYNFNPKTLETEASGSLEFMASSGLQFWSKTARAIKRNPVSKKQNQNDVSKRSQPVQPKWQAPASVKLVTKATAESS